MMHIRQGKPPGCKSGSIILEIAVVTPVFLLLGAFMLIAISCARADILFSQAVDQVTQELAVAVPIAGAGIDIAGEALSVINKVSSTGGQPEQDDKSAGKAGDILTGAAGGIGAVLEALGIEGEDVFGTLLFGEGIRNRIVETFYTYNPSDTLIHSRIKDVSVYINYDEPGKVIWIIVYYKWNTLFGSAERKIVSAVPIFGDLELTLPAAPAGSTGEDKVWQLSNFERGYSLRTTFGDNLPDNYPVIAKWDGITATSIKSIDLTAPGYQTPGILSENVMEFTDELAGFDGTDQPWGKDKVQIDSGDICARVLTIIVPANSPSKAYNELMSASQYAGAKGVQIKIEEFGNSYRYNENGEDVQSSDNNDSDNNEPG